VAGEGELGFDEGIHFFGKAEIWKC
jgi:hypothetical protein